MGTKINEVTALTAEMAEKVSREAPEGAQEKMSQELTQEVSGKLSTDAAPGADVEKLHALVDTILMKRSQERLATHLAARVEKGSTREQIVAGLPTVWRATGLLDWLGEGVVSKGEEMVGISKDVDVAGVPVTVEIFADTTYANPTYGLQIRTPGYLYINTAKASLDADLTPDLVEEMLGLIANGIEKTRVLRQRAHMVIAKAQEVADMWSEWNAAVAKRDDEMRQRAGDLTLRLWEPMEMWKLRGWAANITGKPGGRKEIVVLESPLDVASALREGRPALVSEVNEDGSVREKWMFGASEMTMLENTEPTIEAKLPYHRSYQVGKYWVNVPVTSTRTVGEEAELAASHKNGLSDVRPHPGSLHLGEGALPVATGRGGMVSAPVGVWDAFVREMNLGFWSAPWDSDMTEEQWSVLLAQMEADDMVERFPVELGWKQLKGELTGGAL